ncbi:MAG: glutamine--fructose-6-phosphate transaminase (isomerizing) [Bacilli bacterium]|nr:glutamine--fructose-6-phosphate transaminase (isomerizing) [Bacilli bacterium]
MCGIIGYIGKENPKEFLIEGLKKLEYRGYDSAGIALKNKTETQIIKSVGKISSLEEKVNNEKIIEANIGIAHTRWATHGIPSEVNAHPHKVGKITLVHNGIIENAKELKEELQKENVEFKTTTDTEVIAALMNYYYKDDVKAAIEKTIKRLKGSYALAIICDDCEKLYAIRCESPLILGVKEDGFFVTSDIGAIINHTNKYVLLGENEIVEMDYNNYKITKNGQEIKREINISDLKDKDNNLQGYEHYMMKEIMEEPVLVDNIIRKYKDNLDLLPDLKKYKHIHIVGCGSAYYAGMIGKYLFEDDGIKVEIDVASEYRYRNIIYEKDTLVILISQSGETADTIAAMRKANSNNADTLAIVNVETSTIARECTYKVLIEAGREVAVATTKAFILQVLIISLLSYKIKEDKKYLEDLVKIPQQLKVLLDKSGFYKKLADSIYKHEDVFFIGRRIDYAISMEGSLKLKEVSYIHSDSYQAGELKHGTISLINDGTIVFAIVTDEETHDKTISNLEEVISRGAHPIYVGTEECSYESSIIVPKVHKKLQPLLVVPTLQMIAYYVAYKRGCDIDKPKNLAKSVTVE